uniref:Peroxidase n=1 Tax=Opuntia streptacantha TaxID=393608 RepID=A0A7C8ZFC1_OPUST
MTARGVDILGRNQGFASSQSDQLLMVSPNFPLLSSLLAISLAQFLKLFTTWYKEKRWDSQKMIGSGGMPSSHSAGVSALAVAIGIQEGTGGSAFALAVVMACVVCTP